MNKILLGKGVFYINEVAVGLTRGGGQFTVEREYRQIPADGDRGPVKDRISQDTSVPKLMFNSLEVINTSMTKMYPATKEVAGADKTTITGTGKIVTADYQDTVKFVGQTKDGKAVSIIVKNAINLENIDWALVDKDEVISAITYTGCYLEDSPAEFEPWDIEYATA